MPVQIVSTMTRTRLETNKREVHRSGQTGERRAKCPHVDNLWRKKARLGPVFSNVGPNKRPMIWMPSPRYASLRIASTTLTTHLGAPFKDPRGSFPAGNHLMQPLTSSYHIATLCLIIIDCDLEHVITTHSYTKNMRVHLQHFTLSYNIFGPLIGRHVLLQ